MIQIQEGGFQTDYGYDVDGVRVSSNTDGDITNYLVDRNRPYAQVLEERDGSGSLTVDYVHGDDLISQHRGGGNYFYLYDGQVSTRQLTDASEDVANEYTYDAFGITLDQTGVVANNYMYTGEQYDPNAGFYYLRARYYNQDIGRFTSQDTWQGNIFEPVSLHKYLYANCNPVMFVDPSGEYTLAGQMTVVSIVSVLAKIVTPHYIGISSAILIFYPGENEITLRIFVNGKLESFFTYEARNDVVKGKTKIEKGFNSDNIFPRVIEKSRECGPGDWTYIDTKHPAGKDIHGGGSCKKDPYIPRQGWCKTEGCVRMQNEDVRALSKKILQFKKEKNQPVRFEVN